jgi:hypothetical protein
MPRSFPVGMSDEKRAEYQAAADKVGVSLAQWIREACDTKLTIDQGIAAAIHVEPAAPTEMTITKQGLELLAKKAGFKLVPVGEQSKVGDLAVFRGPDQKPSQRRKEKT